MIKTTLKRCLAMLLVVTILASMFSIAGFAADQITIMVPPGVSAGNGHVMNDSVGDSMTTPVYLGENKINDYTVSVADPTIVSADKIEDGILQIKSLAAGTTTMTLATEDAAVSATITFVITDPSGGEVSGGSATGDIYFTLPMGEKAGDGYVINEMVGNGMAVPVYRGDTVITEYSVTVADPTIVSARKRDDGNLEFTMVKAGETTMTLSAADDSVSATITFRVTSGLQQGLMLNAPQGEALNYAFTPDGGEIRIPVGFSFDIPAFVDGAIVTKYQGYKVEIADPSLLSAEYMIGGNVQFTGLKAGDTKLTATSGECSSTFTVRVTDDLPEEGVIPGIGGQVRWTRQNGVLTVSPSGAVTAVPVISDELFQDITEIVFSEGITEVRYGVFSGMPSVKKYTFPSTIELVQVENGTDLTDYTFVDFDKADVYFINPDGMEGPPPAQEDENTLIMLCDGYSVEDRCKFAGVVDWAMPVLLYKDEQFVKIKSVTSSNETVVEVNETDGVWTITPMQLGRATITAEDVNGNEITAECVIDGRVTQLGWESDIIIDLPLAEDYTGTTVSIGAEKTDVASYIIDTTHPYFDLVKMKATVTEPGVYRFSMQMDKYANTSAYSRTTRIAGFGVRDMIGGGMMGNDYQLSTWEIYNIKTPGEYEFASVVAKRGVDRESGVWATFEEYAYPMGFKNAQLGADGIVSGSVEGFYNPEDETDGVVTNGHSVSIDVSVEQGDHVVGTAVTVTASSAGSMVDNNVASVTLSTNVADVCFDKTALEKLLTSIENEGIDAKLNVMVSDGSEAKVISLNLNVNGSEVLPESTSGENGAVTVTIPYEGVEEGDTVEVYYLKNGTMVAVDAVYDLETKTVTFTTNHFSDYQISKTSEGDNGSIGHNINWTFADGVLTLSGLGDMAAQPSEWRELEITKVVVGEGITSIRDFAFSEMESLKEVSLPNTLETIGYQAFYSTGLQEIVIPDSVIYIEYNAFANCQSLKKAVISDNVENLGMDIFNSCTALSEVSLPANATRIGVNTFYGCAALEKIVLPNKLEEIAQDAFTGTGVTAVGIPASVIIMGDRCFGYNTDGTANASFRLCGENEVAEAYAINNGMLYGHIEQDVSGKEATCTETGLTAGTKCSVCDTILVEQKEIAVKAHTEVIDKAVEATCTETGLTEGKQCSVCKNVLVEQEVVKATGHKWNDGEITRKPTATAAGETTYTCTVCTDTKLEVIPATGACDGGNECASKAFVDNQGWFHDAIDYAVDNGLMIGTSATTFAPDETMTRAMVVTVLHRYDGEKKIGSNKFTDVLAGKWYTDAVTWAAEIGVVLGTTPTTFAPEDAVTREQIAVILYRYAEYLELDVSARGSLKKFGDGDQVSDYAQAAMQWAVAEGLINGVTTTTLNPGGDATRAEVATILMRFIQNVVEK